MSPERNTPSISPEVLAHCEATAIGDPVTDSEVKLALDISSGKRPYGQRAMATMRDALGVIAKDLAVRGAMAQEAGSTFSYALEDWKVHAFGKEIAKGSGSGEPRDPSGAQLHAYRRLIEGFVRGRGVRTQRPEPPKKSQPKRDSVYADRRQRSGLPRKP